MAVCDLDEAMKICEKEKYAFFLFTELKKIIIVFAIRAKLYCDKNILFL